MGNHEYCPDCGENDFHRGRPCNPASLEKQDKHQAWVENRSKKADAKIQLLAAFINNNLGHQTVINEYGNLVIPKHQFYED